MASESYEERKANRARAREEIDRLRQQSPPWHSQPAPAVRSLQCSYCSERFASIFSLSAHTFRIHQDVVTSGERRRIAELVSQAAKESRG